MKVSRYQRAAALLSALVSLPGCDGATSPSSGALASVCAGSSPQPLQPLGVYVYPLPEDIPHNESFYTEGYEQYTTELVIPQLLRGSIHAEADPHRASLFLVPNQGVRGCEPSRFAVRTRLCSCCHR